MVVGKLSGFAFVVSLALSALPAAAQTAPTGAWATKSPLPATFFLGGSASTGTELFVFGSLLATTNTRKFDPVANAWSLMAPLPVAVGRSLGAYYSGKIYSFAGLTAPFAIYEYTVAANAWNPTPVANLPLQRYYGSAAVLGSKIYITGGLVSGVVSASVLEFDPATNTLATMTNMPAANQHHASAVLAGKLYVFGGSGPQTHCWEYDPATGTGGTWTVRAPISDGTVPAPRQQSFAMPLSGRIYLTGGSGTGTTTLEYTPASNSWARRANMAASHNASGGGVVGNIGYVIGGQSTLAVEEFTPPDFGTRPNPAAQVRQSGTLGETLQGEWTGPSVTLSADVSDPDLGQQVMLEVQVKPAAGSWAGQPILSTGLQDPGMLSVTYAIPAEGGYDWRYRVSDAAGNYTPTVNFLPDWTEFNDNGVSPDFLSDQIGPSVPIPIYPSATGSSPVAGSIGFSWSPSTDNGPGAVTYEIGIYSLEPAGPRVVFSTAGITIPSISVNLVSGRFAYGWQVRCRDAVGIMSAWSPRIDFAVADGQDNASGDAQKACGFAIPAEGSFPLAGLMAIALAFAAAKRRI